MIKVSIIVPIYGVEKYIEKCARSIFEQSYQNLDIVFVNDCTLDNSISILKSTLEEYPLLKEKTRILSYSQNRGLAGARKFGLEHSIGDYVLQIDSDDFIAPEMVETMVKAQEKERADIVICDFNILKGDTLSHLSVNPSLNHIDCMRQVLTGEVHGSVANKLINKDLYVSNNIWPTEGLNMCEDLSVMYRLMYFARTIAYVPEPFYFYLQREGSYCHKGLTRQHQQNLLDLTLQINKFFKDNNIIQRELIDASLYNKAVCRIYLLFYGDKQIYKNSVFSNIPLKFYLTHPTMPIRWKFIAILDYLKLHILINFIQRIIMQKK